MTKNPPTIPISPPRLNSITKTIYCQNSGVVLGTLEVLILEGHLAYLESHSESVYLHPFYKMGNNVLLKKLEDCLHKCQEQGWVCSHAEQQRLQLLCSAIMFSLDSIKQDGPSLPSFQIAAASAGRLVGLTKWFFFASSQRLAFPLYSVSIRNENRNWENFKHWIDSAYDIRNTWSNGKRELQKEAEIRAREQSIKEIKSESFRRVDTRKVWNWLHLQLADHLSFGRLETFKNLFLNGDLEAHEWTTDDVEDLQEALLMYCDIGNDIMHFVNKRLEGIRGLIKDFYSSFTLLTKVGDSSKFTNEQQTPEELSFFAEFDKRAELLESLPNGPKREDFATLGLFLKAQASHRILTKRFNALQLNKTAIPQPPAVQTESGPADMFGEL